MPLLSSGHMQCRQHIRPPRYLASLLAVLALAATCFAGAAGGTAQAATTPGNAALDWAESYALGHPYVWGGTGPSYDCSGLVMEAVGHATGIWLPRTTYAMMGSSHLYQVSWPERGDLVFLYGGAHVEFATPMWGDATFGAHDSGSQVGWLNWYLWPPGTSFWRIR